ncbi:MAG: antitoxin Xre/MbcA/ParS toxin-binding domain-containing protein [Gemmatimonadota bacterium]
MAVLARQLRALEDAHDRLGLSYRNLSDVLRADESTLHRWRSGTSEPSPAFLDRLEALGEFLEQLRATFRSDDAARTWLDREVPELGGGTPRKQLLAGRVERLTAILLGLNVGVTT